MPNLMEIGYKLLKLQKKTYGLHFCGHSVYLIKHKIKLNK